MSPGGGGDYLCYDLAVTGGTLISGDHTSVQASDDSYLAVESKKLSGKQTSHVDYYFDTDLSSLSARTITVELHPSVAPQRQRIRVYDFSSSSWDQVGDREITGTGDTTTVVNVSSSAPYLSTGGEVHV